jgi:DNA-binding IclR family transcriptional regulator
MVAECDESAYIAILRDEHVVDLDMIDTTKTIKVISRVGLRVPADCTAIGKAQLAFESEDELDRIFEGKVLERFTKNTITDIEKLRDELREASNEGVAIDNGEYEEEIKCVGVPIRDYTRRVVAGICISGPFFRMSKDRIKNELTPLVKDAGMRISMKLGFPGD